MEPNNTQQSKQFAGSGYGGQSQTSQHNTKQEYVTELCFPDSGSPGGHDHIEATFRTTTLESAKAAVKRFLGGENPNFSEQGSGEQTYIYASKWKEPIGWCMKLSVPANLAVGSRHQEPVAA